MTPRYILAPEAAQDLIRIWRYLNERGGVDVADRVEFSIRDRILFLSNMPDAGHWRKDLTDQPVKFFPIYSYLSVYRPETKPLQVVAILHASRNVERILAERG